jgi:hypothetical protein
MEQYPCAVCDGWYDKENLIICTCGNLICHACIIEGCCPECGERICHD